MRAGVWLAVLCGAGCYLHHERAHDAANTPDASVDAAVDAALDASIDAALDGPLDVRPDAPLCEFVTLMPEPITAPVDIVWSIDSSMSMQDERARLQATINDFARQVSQRVRDLRVVVITRDNIVPPPLGTDPDRFLFVSQPVDSNDALNTLISVFDQYRSFLRTEALLHFVVVSDDDSTLPADRFKSLADQLFAKPYTVHAIASPDVNGGPCRSEVPSTLCMQTGIQAVCGAAAIGVEYYRSAQMTDGLTIDVCLDDWSRVIGPLSDAVVGAEPVPCRAALPLRQDGRWAADVQARLLVTGVEPRRLSSVSSAGECGDALAFYRESPEGSDVDNFVLCPRACDETTASGGAIEFALDCVSLID